MQKGAVIDTSYASALTSAEEVTNATPLGSETPSGNFHTDLAAYSQLVVSLSVVAPQSATLSFVLEVDFGLIEL